MTEQEKVTLIETEQRSLSNARRIDTVEEEMHEIKNDQKAIYKIATSVEVIAQRVSDIEDKVDDTNAKVNKLSDRVEDAENRPYKQVATNWNSVKVAIITAVCTMLATGVVTMLINYGAK